MNSTKIVDHVFKQIRNEQSDGNDDFHRTRRQIHRQAVRIVLKFAPGCGVEGTEDASFVARRLIADSRLAQIVTTELDGDAARVSLFFVDGVSPDDTVDFVEDAVYRLRGGVRATDYQVSGAVVLKGGPGGVFEYVGDKTDENAETQD